MILLALYTIIGIATGLWAAFRLRPDPSDPLFQSGWGVTAILAIAAALCWPLTWLLVAADAILLPEEPD